MRSGNLRDTSRPTEDGSVILQTQFYGREASPLLHYSENSARALTGKRKRLSALASHTRDLVELATILPNAMVLDAEN